MISPCKTAQNPKNFALRAQFFRRAVNIFQILTNVVPGGVILRVGVRNTIRKSQNLCQKNWNFGFKQFLTACTIF